MNLGCIQILKDHKLRTTRFRVEVLELFMKSPHSALSNQDLEDQLDDCDRITLYRTLKSFEKAEIIHQVIDGSKVSKYALCHSNCAIHDHQEDHAHFLCNSCGKTYCIAETSKIDLKIPENYKLERIHLALTGICANCN